MKSTRSTAITHSSMDAATASVPVADVDGVIEQHGNPEPMQQSVTRLRLAAVLRARLEAMVSKGYPAETCGLLLGRQTQALVEVIDLVQARNLNRERARDRYELDPNDWLAADSDARERDLEIVGVWHSHPDHPAHPSATDRENAWVGWSYVIVSISRDGIKDLRSWRLLDGNFTEEAVE